MSKSDKLPRAEVNELIRKANGQISEQLPEIISKLIELGQGVTVEGRRRGDGKPVIYSEAPNFRALEYLCNRVLGKPVDSATLAGEGQVSEITVRYVDDWREIPDTSPVDK